MYLYLIINSVQYISKTYFYANLEKKILCNKFNILINYF